MHALINRVTSAIQDLQQGKMVILLDHPDRENEGDLVCAAEVMTTDMMNFMIRHTSGIVCLPLTSHQLKKLNLPLMVSPQENSSLRGTPFTVSIDAKEGITTGVSAADRIHTLRVAIGEQTQPQDLVKPGHIFPLQAKEHGVLERAGHTEGALDVVRLAGFKPAAVLCEIMNADGSMAKGNDLIEFAKTHQLKMLSIDDLITYRLRCENFIEKEASATLPLEHYGTFKISVIKDKLNQQEHIVLTKEGKNANLPLVRIHSSCITGDLFHSNRCDCHDQLHYSLQKISQEGGILIYLNQEGRGIGLFNKIQAYALQEHGFDTVEANKQLGLPVDSRQYYIAANILRHRHIQHFRLLTNNPEKITDLKKYGDFLIEKESIPTFSNQHNIQYLNVKKTKLRHTIAL